jgi:hypothetical protein
MNLSQFKEEFLILYDKITNFSAPGYEDIEISYFLTKAQERIVLDAYDSIIPNKLSFEETEKRRKQLSELVIPNVPLTQSIDQSGAEGKFYDLPEDCFLVIKEKAKITGCPCCENEFKQVKPVTHDEFEINKDNPFKKPDEKILWRLDVNGRRHDLISKTGTNISEYRISYIRKPEPIILDGSTIDNVTGPNECKLNSIIQRLIIDEAVKIATSITNPQEYQIKTIEKQLSE